MKGALSMAVKVGEKNGAHGNGHAPLRAVLYARVSTEEQSRRESIETQIHYARQQCEREGIPLGQIYKDEGVSGTVPFESRPGGKQLLADARAGKFETVLLYKVDRLGRSDVVSHIARHHLETLSVGLRSLTEPFDTSTPHGRFMFSILSANSAMERENIRERSRAGLYRVASQGRWACGRPPYGYRLDNQRLVPDEEEAKILRRIFQRAVKRESLVAVCAYLNNRGYTTREGKRWRFPTIGRLLHQSVYRGVHEWGKGETITRSVPALVSETTWYAAQEALKLNTKANRGNSKHNYLLKSLVKCGFCRRSMTGNRKHYYGEAQHYYRCSGRHDPEHAVTCVNGYPNAAWLESLVWNTLTDWIINRGDLETALVTAMQEQEQERLELVQTVTLLHQHIAEKTTEHDRVVSAFRRGLLSEDDLSRQLGEIDREKRRLVETVTEMERRDLHVSTELLTSSLRQTLDRYRQDVQKGHLPFLQQRHIVESFVEEVRVCLPKGTALSEEIREIIPFRQFSTEPAPTETRTETLWERDAASHSTPTPMVEIRYRFPWPQAENLLEINSHSPLCM
jgi:site-specific DNA recombinase